MPSYDYYCPANSRTLEVRHGMNERLATWGELCARAQLDLGGTPPDSPVTRLITGASVIRGSRSDPAPVPAGCPHGRCGCA